MGDLFGATHLFLVVVDNLYSGEIDRTYREH
jgi:hypothetical protein